MDPETNPDPKIISGFGSSFQRKSTNPDPSSPIFYLILTSINHDITGAYLKNRDIQCFGSNKWIFQKSRLLADSGAVQDKVRGSWDESPERLDPRRKILPLEILLLKAFIHSIF